MYALYPGKRIFLLLVTTAIMLSPAEIQATEVRSTGDRKPLEATEIAIFSRVYNGYARTSRTDGTLAPETYTFGQGKRLDGSGDPSIDDMTFLEIAQALAPALAAKAYRPTQHPKETQLLVVVSWGTTTGGRNFRGQTDDAMQRFRNSRLAVLPHASSAQKQFEPESQLEQKLVEQQMEVAMTAILTENRLRDESVEWNARLLGYWEDFIDSQSIAQVNSRHHDLLRELEDNRYFVILEAYDFQEILKRDTMKRLWTTRFSIRQQGNSFHDRLAAMAKAASGFFGRESKGLVRDRTTEVKVEYGELKTLEFLPAK